MRKFSLLGVALASCLLASAAGSGDKLTGDQIRSLVTGNTVQGSMEASGGYTEFYAEDGTIKGKDNTGANYQGAWSIDGRKDTVVQNKTMTSDADIVFILAGRRTVIAS